MMKKIASVLNLYITYIPSYAEEEGDNPLYLHDSTKTLLVHLFGPRNVGEVKAWEGNLVIPTLVLFS